MLADKIKEQIKKACGIDVIVEDISVPKNNGVVEKGLVIKQEGSRFGATIYPERFCEDYESLEEVGQNILAKKIAETYKKTACKDSDGITSFIDSLDADEVYRRVIPAVVSKNNFSNLDDQDIFHESYLDMEIVYRVVVSKNKEGFMSFLIKNDFIKSIGADINVLKECALDNLNASAQIESIASVINRMGSPVSIPDDGSFPMYVITSNDMNYGANVIISEKVLSDVHDITGADSVYILPSSVNEIIAIPTFYGEEYGIEELKQMVFLINRESIQETDRLTDSVYIHSRDGRMEVA